MQQEGFRLPGLGCLAMVLAFWLVGWFGCGRGGAPPGTQASQFRAGAPQEGHFLALSLTNIPTPAFPHRFWMEGRIELPGRRPPDQGLVAYLARFRVADSLVYLLAGYDFDGYRIRCALVDSAGLARWGSEEVAGLLAEKQVTIVPVEKHLFFKLLWDWQNRRVRFEVNGVPVRFAFPYRKEQLTGVGYLNRLRQATVQQPRFRGD